MRKKSVVAIDFVASCVMAAVFLVMFAVKATYHLLKGG